MLSSRLGRLEERRARKRLVLAVVGSLAVLVFIAIFGVKLLVWFSLLVDKSRGAQPPATNKEQTIVLPPVVDALPIATNSSTLKISGTGTAKLTAIIYINEREFKRTTVARDGTFSITSNQLKEGPTTISAKLMDDKANMSELSNVLTVLIKRTPPTLEINDPQNGASILGDSNMVSVNGKTESEASVTINDRLAVVRGDGTFTYDYPLNEGENKLTITATDAAGNKTTEERTVSYHK